MKTRSGGIIKSWGQIGLRHGEFRTPHALKFDSQGRLWVADRGNHRIEIFDQNGAYLESRYMFKRNSDWVFFRRVGLPSSVWEIEGRVVSSSSGLLQIVVRWGG